MASKQARAYIAKEIVDYHSTKKEMVEIEKDIILSRGAEEKVSNHGHVDVISYKVTALINHKTLQQMRNFVIAFEEVYEMLPAEKQRMIHLLYWSNRDLNCDGVGMEMGVDGSTVGRWRKSILSTIAERMGLK